MIALRSFRFTRVMFFFVGSSLACNHSTRRGEGGGRKQGKTSSRHEEAWLILQDAIISSTYLGIIHPSPRHEISN
jgi:hypothetical protein